MKNKIYHKLEDNWYEISVQMTLDQTIVNDTWEDLCKHYKQKNRAYHNLTHLNNMFEELKQFEEEVADLRILKFSIWMHDLIYNPMRKDNEKKSAEYAQSFLKRINTLPEDIARCYYQIMLTKHHQAEPDDGLDERLMIDLDLEILSRDWETYRLYSEQIRQEYWMYPGFAYKKGRKAALKHFLERDFIYQTEFYRKREAQARENIEREIAELL